MLVVGIDEDEAVLAAAEKVVEFALGLDDALERTKALQMGTAYVGDQATSRLCRLSERLDVARMTGAHLDDGNLVFLRQSEEGFGHAYIVVEVALSVEHIVFLREHSSDEFLGGRLAVGARDADDRNVELATMLTRQILEGLQTVRDDNQPFIASIGERLIVYDSIGAAFLKGLKGELVAVERLTLEGKEDAPFRTITTVCRDDGMLLIELV